MDTEADIQRAHIRQAGMAIKNGLIEDKTPAALSARAIAAIRKYEAGETEVRPIGPLVAIRRLHSAEWFAEIVKALVCTARLQNRERGTPRREMARELELLDFGIRVLRLREQGWEVGRAIADAYSETGRPVISDRAIRKSYWEPFCSIVQARKFVPYWERDKQTGLFLPTRFVPSQTKGRRGRKRKIK